MSYFYKVLDKPPYKKNIYAQLVHDFVVQDLGVTPFEIKFIQYAGGDPMARLEHILWPRDNAHRPKGIYMDQKIYGNVYCSAREVYVDVEQDPRELVKTMLHEAKHLSDYQRGLIPHGQVEHHFAESRAIEYEKSGFNKFCDWLDVVYEKAKRGA